MSASTKDIVPAFLARAEKRAKRQPRIMKKFYGLVREELGRVSGLMGLPLHEAAVRTTLNECEKKQKALLRRKERKRK